MRERLSGWVCPLLCHLRKGTIRARLLGLFSLLIAAISVFIYLFFPDAIERQALEGIRTQAESIGAMAANSVASAVWFDDETDMEAALEGARVNEDVEYIEVTDVDGRVLASLGGTVGEVPPAPGVGGGRGFEEVRGDRFLGSRTPVEFSGQHIGAVRLELSLLKMREQVTRARTTVLFVSLLIFVIGVLAVVAIGSHVTAPLRSVVSTAEKISSGEFSSRAPAETDDELGQLGRSFNRMVDRLQVAREELALSMGQLEQVLDNIPADVALYDPEGCYLYANPAAIENPADRKWVLGRTPVEYAARTGAETEVGRTALDGVRRCVRERRLINTEQVTRGPASEERHLVRFFSPVLDGSGTVDRVIAYGLDISDLRAAEAELRETQARLLQSQKMESIGRLAGGVAHDFNNLLTTITGNAELLLMDMDGSNPARDDVGEIHEAAERASSLTQQLLAFSRKQVTQPKVMSLNDSVTGVEKMLKRLIGEDVVLNTRLADSLGSIRADPGQIEQVIMNLAVNARDAMPKGGVITIRTQNLVFDETPETRQGDDVPSGRYVMIAVTDTGVGMDEETKEKIFEPFFTKKGPGKGTGLGLATVYGIVQQAGGHIRVYSEPEMGTTFKVFFPWVGQEADAPLHARPVVSLPLGTETILVVEDQEGVRNMTRKILERCGYNVLLAEGGQQAIGVAETYEDPIHVLLTDVVMPGMSGPELVESLSQIRPATPVIFMSGYTDDQLQHHGVLNEGVVLIEKPFSAKKLAGTIRLVLEGGGRESTLADLR